MMMMKRKKTERLCDLVKNVRDLFLPVFFCPACSLIVIML